MLSVYAEPDSLLVTLQRDVEEYLKHERAEIFSELFRTDNNSVDQNYVSWWRNFVNVLIALPYPTDYHLRLIAELKKYFPGETVSELEHSYLPERNAIRWYSRCGYFYRTLNRALRQRNIRLLLLFGVFLQDLHQQLKRAHEAQQQARAANPNVKLYRGQVMSNEEFRRLEFGSPIQSNTLFSTSEDRLTALGFLMASSSEMTEVERVLFEIDADYAHLYDTSAPFGDISRLSYFPGESETLFMPGSWFHLVSIETGTVANGVAGMPFTVIKLKLDQHYDMHSDSVLQAETHRKTLKNCLNSLYQSLDSVSTEDIKILFRELRQMYPEEGKWIRAVDLYCLGFRFGQCYNPHIPDKDSSSMATSCHEEAYSIWVDYLKDGDTELNCEFDIAKNLHAMGDIYGVRCDNYEAAANYYAQAVLSYEHALANNSIRDYNRLDILYSLVTICRNLTEVGHNALENGPKAIQYQEKINQVILKEERLLSQPKSIARGYEALADLYKLTGDFSKALLYFEKALEPYLNADEANIEHLKHVQQLYDGITTACIELKADDSLAHMYQMQRQAYLLKHEDDFLANAHFTLAETCINSQEYETARVHLLVGLDHNRKSRDLMLESDPDGYSVKLQEQEIKIEKYEGKLKLVESFL